MPTFAVRRRRASIGGISPPMIPMLDYTLLLPGPYRVCSPESRLQPVR